MSPLEHEQHESAYVPERISCWGLLSILLRILLACATIALFTVGVCLVASWLWVEIDVQSIASPGRLRVGDTGEMVVGVFNESRSQPICGVRLFFYTPFWEEGTQFFSGYLVDYGSVAGTTYRDSDKVVIDGLRISPQTFASIAIPVKALRAGDYSGTLTVEPKGCSWFAFSRGRATVYVELQVEE